MKTKTRAGEIDKRIGENLRLIRLSHGMTQQKLAERIGVTFQQVQKYERGTNRISASTLYEIASIFDEPIICFYFKLDHKPDNPPRSLSNATKEDASLIRAVMALSPQWRKIIKSIARKASKNDPV